jgi:hypothetical protein
MRITKGGALAALGDAVSRYRTLLTLAYLLFLALLAVAYTFIGSALLDDPFISGWTNRLHLLSSGDIVYSFTVVVAFLALQALFLWGGGRIRLESKPTRFRKVGHSLIVFATLMFVVTAGIVESFAEIGGEVVDVGSLSPFAPAPSSNIVRFLPILVLIAIWSCWLLIGWFALRHVDNPTALSRLIGILLAGSWIEFSAALPIHIGTRRPDDNCPCISLSWLAVIAGAPIIVWAIGPGLYLLYLQQKHIEQRDHRHATKILLRKCLSVRIRKRP